MKVDRLLIIAFTTIVLSCTNKSSPKVINPLNEKGLTLGYLPDTIALNETFSGNLHYSSELDTVKINSNNSRTIFLFITTENGIYKEYEDIEKVKHWVFTPDDNGIIDFRFKFETAGHQSVKGILEDMVILENYYPDGKARVITRNYEITFDCTVLDGNK